jgi:predicted transposase YdaD
MTKFDLSVYPNLLKATEILDESNYSQAQLDAYDKHLLAVYDINRSRIESYDRGHGEGREKGREEGREEGVIISVPLIKELLKGELSYEQIASKYSVSLKLVQKLAREI